MISNDQSDLQCMQEKLRMLEDAYQAAKVDATCDPHIQEIELRSLKDLINRVKEEIARVEIRAGTPSRTVSASTAR